MRYPVSEATCSSCSMCSLVTRDLAGNRTKPEEYYYQCLAMAESDCKERENAGKE